MTTQEVEEWAVPVHRVRRWCAMNLFPDEDEQRLADRISAADGVSGQTPKPWRAASPQPWLRFVGVPENAEQRGSLVSDVRSVIQRGARLGDHGRFPDEDLHGEVIGAIADDHALQVVAFPRGLDVQRSTAVQKPIAILTVALIERSKVRWLARSSQRATLSLSKGAPVSDLSWPSPKTWSGFANGAAGTGGRAGRRT